MPVRSGTPVEVHDGYGIVKRFVEIHYDRPAPNMIRIVIVVVPEFIDEIADTSADELADHYEMHARDHAARVAKEKNVPSPYSIHYMFVEPDFDAIVEEGESR